MNFIIIRMHGTALNNIIINYAITYSIQFIILFNIL